MTAAGPPYNVTVTFRRLNRSHNICPQLFSRNKNVSESQSTRQSIYVYKAVRLCVCKFAYNSGIGGVLVSKGVPGMISGSKKFGVGSGSGWGAENLYV